MLPPIYRPEYGGIQQCGSALWAHPDSIQNDFGPDEYVVACRQQEADAPITRKILPRKVQANHEICQLAPVMVYRLTASCGTDAWLASFFSTCS
jgi:hypothetical protein